MSHLTSEQIQNAFSAFHEDEQGESSALSNIMLIAIAAIIIVAIVTFATGGWQTVGDWIKDKVFPK